MVGRSYDDGESHVFNGSEGPDIIEPATSAPDWLGAWGLGAKVGPARLYGHGGDDLLDVRSSIGNGNRAEGQGGDDMIVERLI